MHTFAWAQNSDSLKNERFSIHAQTTIINQYKPSFFASYSGANSLKTEEESKVSITSTLYAGLRLWKGASIFINPEIAGGSGLSEALGVGDALNGETFRIGNPAPQIYLARLYYQQVFSLSDEKVFQSSESNQLQGHLPSKYFSITVGKVGIADFFDNNKFSHDPRTQFLAWSLMSNGAWDYPANTRGYTPSVVLEYTGINNELRYAASLMPLTANGNIMNWNIANASSHTLEYVHRHKIGKRKGALRALGFFTTCNMGNYRESVAQDVINPFIESSRNYGHTKYGFGLNLEQDISANFGFFMRASWNDGNNETWAFTEIDQSASVGFSLNGAKWKRKNDNIGLAYVISGLSDPHIAYLKAGGKGFMLGDGYINYGAENLGEFFYSFGLYKENIFITGTYQVLVNPGYNRDRQGPVNVFSVRLHARI